MGNLPQNSPPHPFTESSTFAGPGGGPTGRGVPGCVLGSVPAGDVFGTTRGIFGRSELLHVVAGLVVWIVSIVGVDVSDLHWRCTFGACMCAGLRKTIGPCLCSGTAGPGLCSGSVGPGFCSGTIAACLCNIRSLAIRAVSCAKTFAAASCLSLGHSDAHVRRRMFPESASWIGVPYLHELAVSTHPPRRLLNCPPARIVIPWPSDHERLKLSTGRSGSRKRESGCEEGGARTGKRKLRGTPNAVSVVLLWHALWSIELYIYVYL